VIKRGLYEKYRVSKVDGSPVDPGAKYFVLRLDTDRAARIAAIAYCEAILSENPRLASELWGLVHECTPPAE
jgi:hypothetical protein